MNWEKGDWSPVKSGLAMRDGGNNELLVTLENYFSNAVENTINSMGVFVLLLKFGIYLSENEKLYKWIISI